MIVFTTEGFRLMRADKINFGSDYILTSANSAKKDNIALKQPAITELTNLKAASFGIIFKGKYHVVKLDSETAEKERNITRKMASLGVSVPYINDNSSYIAEGEIADPDKNPITNRHIRSVLNNIFIMDKAGIAHGDIEEGHVFYSDGGNAEFDCFRYNWNFNTDKERVNREFPDFCHPSNLPQFESNSIGAYIAKMNTTDSSERFTEAYLTEASAFHDKKAKYLEDSGLGTKEQIEYEKIQADVLKEPDSEVVKLYEDKIRIQYQKRLAFTEWDEGNGACGHKVDDTRTTKGVKMHFDSIYDTAKYIDKLKEAKENSSGNKEKYLNYEIKYAKHILNNTINDTCGMATWTMDSYNSKNLSHRNVPEDVKKRFGGKLNELKKTSLDDECLAKKAMDTKKAYSEIIETNDFQA